MAFMPKFYLRRVSKNYNNYKKTHGVPCCTRSLRLKVQVSHFSNISTVCTSVKTFNPKFYVNRHLQCTCNRMNLSKFFFVISLGLDSCLDAYAEDYRSPYSKFRSIDHGKFTSYLLATSAFFPPPFPLSDCPSVSLSICPFVCLSVCLSVF